MYIYIYIERDIDRERERERWSRLGGASEQHANIVMTLASLSDTFCSMRNMNSFQTTLTPDPEQLHKHYSVARQ